MPMPNTKAPMRSEGPSGAIAPPKPGTSAATGTMTAAATAMSNNAASRPSACPSAMNRRHDAVKLNSALRKTAPSAKPQSRSQADAGWPSIRTSATSTAVTSTAPARNGQSSRGTVAGVVASAVAAVMDVALACGRVGSQAEADRLLEIIPSRAHGLDRPPGIGGPLDHRAVIEPYVLAAEKFG